MRTPNYETASRDEILDYATFLFRSGSDDWRNEYFESAQELFDEAWGVLNILGIHAEE